MTTDDNHFIAKNKASLSKMIGKEYIRKKLEEYGFEIEKQKGTTLHLKNNKKIKYGISTFKAENIFKIKKYGSGGVPYWGWAIKQIDANIEQIDAKLPEFDYFICIKIDNNYENYAIDNPDKEEKNKYYKILYKDVKLQFYIFTKNDILNKVDCKNINIYEKKKLLKIQLFENDQSYQDAKRECKDLLTDLDMELNENKSKFLERWDIIHEKS